MSRAGRTTIIDLLEAARRRLDRVTPEQALTAAPQGAVLIDIRSERQRQRDGLIPGIILVCDEGYQSSLASATLQDLGFTRATDLACDDRRRRREPARCARRRDRHATRARCGGRTVR